MLASQVPAFLGYKTAQAASLAGVIVCLLTLAAYCVFQVGWPPMASLALAIHVALQRCGDHMTLDGWLAWSGQHAHLPVVPCCMTHLPWHM